MKQNSVVLGFPDLKGYQMKAQIKSFDSPEIIGLSFSTMSDDRAFWIHTDVFLLNASFGVAEFECRDSFPPMRSYHIAEEHDANKQTKILTIDLENGQLSFIFEHAFHITRKAQVKFAPTSS
jgi:hypothetical protein